MLAKPEFAAYHQVVASDRLPEPDAKPGVV